MLLKLHSHASCAHSHCATHASGINQPVARHDRSVPCPCPGHPVQHAGATVRVSQGTGSGCGAGAYMTIKRCSVQQQAEDCGFHQPSTRSDCCILHGQCSRCGACSMSAGPMPNTSACMVRVCSAQRTVQHGLTCLPLCRRCSCTRLHPSSPTPLHHTTPCSGWAAQAWQPQHLHPSA